MTEELQNAMPHPSFGTTMIGSPELSTEVSKPVRSSLKFHPLLRDLTLTMATEFSILVAGLVLVSLVGRLLGPDALGEYLLLRRVIAWLLTGVLLGMGNALPRYVAHAVKKSEGERTAYFLVASGSLLGVACSVGLVLYLGRQAFARWLFGSSELSNLILPLCLLLVGQAVQTAAYGYYRGIMDLKRANATQVCHFAFIPIGAAALLYPTGSVALIVGVTGSLTLVAAALFAWPIFRQLSKTALPKLRPCATELLRYGVVRVPVEFGSAALFALGPMIATHYERLDHVAYLLLGSSFLMVMGYAAGPLGVVLLSKVSMMLAQNRLGEVRTSLGYLLGAVLDLSVFAALQLVVFADVLVRVWVGPRFLEGIPVVRLLILAIPPYLFYMALRSSIDAVTVKARNTGNVLIALAVYLVLIGATVKWLPATFLLESMAISLIVALVVLGVLTVRTFRELFSLSIPWGRCAPSLAAATALGAASYAFSSVPGVHQAPILAVFFELLVSGLFLGALIKLGSPWLGFVWEMAFPGRRLAGFAAKSQAA